MTTEAAVERNARATCVRSTKPDFRELLGEAAWARLPRTVQRRFSADAHAHDATIYSGSMDVHASLFGRALAHVCRVIGTPVVPFTGPGVNLQVKVFETADGVVWERRYEFPNREPIVVRSTKQLDRDGCLIEALGAGLRMRLRVYEDKGELHFISTGYYFDAIGIRITLPAWFLPGVTHVIHEDLGEGDFRFTMMTDHRWLGRLYFQQGIFH
jgi:hypothetical protein